MGDSDFFQYSRNPANIVKSIGFDLAFMRANPDFFDPVGLWCFVGAQGSGKTLSCIQTVLKLHRQYPKALIVSNLDIKGVDYIPFEDYSQIFEITNGIYGVIFVLDEMQSIWNAMEARDIPLAEVNVLCQNRKDRRLVLGTSQVYGRTAKAIREQYKYVIFCRSFLKYVQWNTVVDPCPDGYTSEDDGHFEGKILWHKLAFHSPAMYQAYDTYHKINRMERRKKRG